MIKWTKKNCFTVDGVEFKAIPLGLGNQQSTPERFIFQKSLWVVERYEKLISQLKPKAIFELGIWCGGSAVFFQRLAQAKKLVTLDITEQRVEALDQYIEANQLHNTLKPFYGVDQGDVARLRQIVRDEFDDGMLDLVIDDASHFVDQTRNSFNALFPLVKPGGVFVIEDWSWAHGKHDGPEDFAAFYPNHAPLTTLIFEIILACPSTGDYIEKIEIDKNSATIWRGTAPIKADDFDIAQCCLSRGRALLAQQEDDVCV
ncbi:MAG: hypothetical protein COB04_12695 [Gammaproteobacteria bacterium]|nr:MAG: hypothetical protein COB04_12695 [Gammaproteobacteria bacterium]